MIFFYIENNENKEEENQNHNQNQNQTENENENENENQNDDIAINFNPNELIKRSKLLDQMLTCKSCNKIKNDRKYCLMLSIFHFDFVLFVFDFGKKKYKNKKYIYI